MTRKRLDESLSPSRLEKSLGGRGTGRPNLNNLVFKNGEVRSMPSLIKKENDEMKNLDDATIAIRNVINDYGMKLVLEALIHDNDQVLISAHVFNTEDDYLLTLKHDLEVTLDNYENRYDERSGPKSKR